jgi:flavin-dependent dehydrogenase
MDACDVLIVGGGPAGSSCAWKLRDSGLDVVILDRKLFPRDKVCGGWITPQILQELAIDPAEYSRGRVFQPITGFRTSRMGDPEIETDYGRTVSYGIRRCEFDDYLLKRSGARVVQGVSLESLERRDQQWIVNEHIKTSLVVGAGGHFCPVARFMGAKAQGEVVVAAQEAEFEMTDREERHCAIRGEMPELYFCPDMKGYGWCFRKGSVLNVGLGRLARHGLTKHVAEFLEFLRRAGKVTFDLPAAMLGHAYLLYAKTRRDPAGDAMMLVGDAAGLAYSQSGEGIRPAVESGLLAAGVIAEARGEFSREQLQAYPRLLEQRFGKTQSDWAFAIGRRIPAWLVGSFARGLLRTQWFSRRVVVDRWFLHREEPALSFGEASLPGKTGPRVRAVDRGLQRV